MSLGLSADILQQLPTHVMRATEKHEDCCICLCPCEAGDTLITLTCAHVFHKECGSRWLKEKRKCPVCQHEIKVG